MIREVNLRKESSLSSLGLSDLKKLVEQPSKAGCRANKVELVAIPTSKGSLGKNIGCEKAPLEILKGRNYETANINNQDFIEITSQLEKLKGDFFIGGDHSITYGLFKGFVKRENIQNKNLALIIFDAHPDCVNNFSPPTHEDFVRVLIEEKVVSPKNVLLVGLKKLDNIEKRFLDEKGVKYICYGERVEEILRDFIRKVDKIYLTIDIDVLNPQEAPGTGYIEDGGFSLKELVGYLRIVIESGRVGQMDLVEVNPDLDIEKKTIGSARAILEFLID